MLLTLRNELLVLQVAAIIHLDRMTGQLLDGGKQRLGARWNLRRCRFGWRLSAIVVRIAATAATVAVTSVAMKQEVVMVVQMLVVLVVWMSLILQKKSNIQIVLCPTDLFIKLNICVQSMLGL